MSLGSIKTDSWEAMTKHKLTKVTLSAAFCALIVAYAASALAEPKKEDGKYVDEDGNPTYYVNKDGVWDWYTFSGNRRYHSECHVCHGPYGLGSSYAPSLADALKTMSYDKFQEIVINGQRNKFRQTNSIMPALGENKNVYCFLDDIYIYLKARASGELKPILPRSMKKGKRPEESREYQNDCMG
jgi:methanol metabolism-related c-type cytochrome